MSEAGKVGTAIDTQDLMNILENGQLQQVELAKKMITMDIANKVSQSEAEGKGQIFDAKA